jgi:RimK family alpha-L-glutamate ligase
VTPTNTRLGVVLTPARALAQLQTGEVALGRLDVLASLDGIEPGLWALDRLEQRGVMVLNRRASLVAAHDKLATARALAAAGLPHPGTEHAASWLDPPALDPPLVVKPRFGSWGRDVYRCDDLDAVADALAAIDEAPWYEATGAVVQRLVEPRGYDLRIVVAGGSVVGAIKRIAAPGEWRTNVALGARREPVLPPADACELAVAAARALDGDLVGVDLLPVDGGWTVLEVNGAVDFTGAYALRDDVYASVRAALLRRPRGRGGSAAAAARAP